MQRWEGRVAFVTGASAGIGAGIAERLVKQGMIVVGFARRAEKVEALSKEMSGHKGKLHAIKGDVRNEEDIIAAFTWVENHLKSPVHVLVNNAGYIIGHYACIAGHSILSFEFGMYTATKYAVTAITEALRKQLWTNKSKTRVTSLSPEAVKSGMAETTPVPGVSVDEIPMILPSDIADAVVFVLSLRQQVHISELTIIQDGKVDYSPLEKMFGKME